MFALAVAACAYLAPLAAASTLEAGSYTATLTGSPAPPQPSGAHVFGFENETGTTCGKEDVASGTLSEAATILTMHRIFANCGAFGFAEATILTTGCDYRYDLVEELSADVFSAEAKLVCEAGKQVKIIAGTCEVQIPAQTLGTVEVVENTAASPMDLSILSALSGIHYLKVKDGAGCPLSGTGESTSGTTTGRQTVVAEKGGGVDLQIGGSPPRFEAGAYPATLTGSPEISAPVEAEHIFGTEGGTVTCTSDSSDGTLSKAASTFSLHRTFTECTAFGFLSATVSTTGCDYRYELGGKIATDVYAASVELVCEAGKKIEIKAVTCEAQVPPQVFSGTVEIFNNTAAVPDDISISSSLTGIHYVNVKDGFLCPLKGTGERTDGTTTSLETVTAETSKPVSLSVSG